MLSTVKVVHPEYTFCYRDSGGQGPDMRAGGRGPINPNTHKQAFKIHIPPLLFIVRGSNGKYVF